MARTRPHDFMPHDLWLTGGRRESRFYLTLKSASAIPLKDFDPGDYTLVISVNDAVTGETAIAEADFSVR